MTPTSNTSAPPRVPDPAAQSEPGPWAYRLLTAGALGGPLYVVVSVAEALLRDGFEPTRHAWSMLANGPYGWVHTLNLALSGLLVVAGSVGLGRVIRGRGPAVLLGLYGLGMVGASLFPADPGRGFPPGTPEVAPVTWHGTLHLVVGGVGFVGLIAACLIIGRRLARADRPRLAWFSQVTGVTFLLTFVALAGSGGAAWSLLGFTGAVILASAWLSTIFVHYRRVSV